MRRALVAALILAGCNAEPAARLGDAPSEAPPAEAAPAESAPSARVFGAAPNPAVPITRLGAIVEDPEPFRDRVVRTEGQIAQVCQRMGCWMELREGESGPAVRVPMAGHSFFLPRDVAGRRAVIEGRVALRELSADHRAHLEGEGATATASALSIEATGVAIQ